MTDPDAPPPGAQVKALRKRAAQCRAFAETYAGQVGPSLGELAVELDRKADAIDAREEEAAGKGTSKSAEAR